MRGFHIRNNQKKYIQKSYKKRRFFNSVNNQYKNFFYGGNRKDPLNLAAVIKNPECSDEPSANEATMSLDDLNETHRFSLPYKATKRDPLGLKIQLKERTNKKRKFDHSNLKDLTQIEAKKLKLETKPKESEKEKKPKFQYGNYPSYYGYRLPGSNPLYCMDPRLSVIPKIWFSKKVILDIGCNAGFISLWVARFFSPNMVYAYDIDKNLIKAAKNNIRYLTNPKTLIKNKVKLHLLSPVTMETESQSEEDLSITETPNNSPPVFPKNIIVKKVNYVPESNHIFENDTLTEKYDVILCLSVTKWIHLNWGDEGLKRAFLKMYLELKPGGRLILEPQPISSYRKKKNINDTTRKNYAEMKLKPEVFPEYLLSNEIGFETMKILPQPRVKFQSKNFNRIIFCFKKSDLPNNRRNNSAGGYFVDLPPTPISSHSFSPDSEYFNGGITSL